MSVQTGEVQRDHVDGAGWTALALRLDGTTCSLPASGAPVSCGSAACEQDAAPSSQ